MIHIFMASEDPKKYFVLGEKRWWLGLVVLTAIIFLFSKNFISDLGDLINDPVYFISVLMVGLAVAAPILWVLNEGKRLILDISKGSKSDDEVFKTLLSLPEGYRAFQGIVLEKEKFDVIVVSPRSLSVIGVYKPKGREGGKEVKDLRSRTERKARLLKQYFGNQTLINTLLVKAVSSSGDREGSEKEKGEMKDLIEPDSLIDTLKKKDAESESELRSGILDQLEDIWKG